MDFLSASRKRPLKEEEEGGESKAAEKPLSPQLFKPSKRRKRGEPHAKKRMAAGQVLKSSKLDITSE